MSKVFQLQGKVMWSYNYEMMEFTSDQKIMAGLSGIANPLHHHKGYIALTEKEIIIESEQEDNYQDILIPLTSINEIYHGYDDIYTAISVKNVGLFWKPLRLNYYDNENNVQNIYLIIDYMGLYTHNKYWFDTLMSIFNS